MRRPVFYAPDEVDDEVLYDTLLLVSITMPMYIIRQWTKYERMVVADWATREHLAASDNLVQRRPKPWLVRAGEMT